MQLYMWYRVLEVELQGEKNPLVILLGIAKFSSSEVVSLYNLTSDIKPCTAVSIL